MDNYCKIRFIIILLISLSYSQPNNYGGGPNTFYKNMFTAREVAMGGAGISSAEGYLANIWNPACIINALNNKEYIIGFNVPMSNVLYSPNNEYNVSKEWLSFGLLKKVVLVNKQKEIYFGASTIHQNYRDLTQTIININNEIEPIGNFNLSQSLFLLSIAGKFDELSIGISSKIIYSDDLYSNSLSSRFGIDAGLLLSFPKPVPFIDMLKYGFVLKSDQDNYNHMTTTGLGISVRKNWSEPIYQVITFDVVTSEFITPKIHLGTDIGRIPSKASRLRNNKKIEKNASGQKSYLDKAGDRIFLTKDASDEVSNNLLRLPGLNLYTGVNSTYDGIISFNVGCGIDFWFGLELDLVYSIYNTNNINSEYYSLVDSALKITFQINSKK